MSDLIKKIRTDDGDKQIDYEALANKPTIDQTYNPTSENAQSGKAVAEAIQPFEINITSGQNGLSANKTFEEIYSAIEQGKIVYVKHNSGIAQNTIVPLSWYNSALVAFSIGAKLMGSTTLFHIDIYIKSDNSIETSYYEPVSLDDIILTINPDNPNTANVVSEKAIVDYVGNIVGDIETALDSIIALQNSLIGGE